MRRGSEKNPRRFRASLPWALVAWGVVVLYMGFIFYLSSESNPLPELTAWVWDKLLHTCEYGTLGALLAFALRASGMTGGYAFFVAALLSSLYGSTDEIHQAFVPQRDCDLHDLAADTVGGALGAGAFLLALRLLFARSSIRRARPVG